MPTTRPGPCLVVATAIWIVVGALASAAATSVPVPVDHYFVYDGQTSDLVQHYYLRYLAKNSLPPLKIADGVPTPVIQYLRTHGLTFGQLPGLLQRAVLWELGYVLNPDDYPIKIYTRCGRTMAEIAVPIKGYMHGGCVPRNCSTPNGGVFHRSMFCNGQQMAAASLCASADSSIPGHSAMWADGAEPDGLPEPRLYRHAWSSDGRNFLMFAVHTKGYEAEVAWDRCPTTPAPIFPCQPYDMADKRRWCEPVRGKILEAWIQNYALQQRTGVTRTAIAAITTIGVLLLTFLGLWLRRRRQNRQSSERSSQVNKSKTNAAVNSKSALDSSSPSRASSPGASVIMGDTPRSSDGRESTHNLLDSVADMEYVAWLQRKGHRVDGEGAEDQPEIASGREDAAFKTLQVFESHPLILCRQISLKTLQLVRQLSAGATGEVWLALRNQKEQVAVKRLLPEKKQRLAEIQLFASEIFILAKLRHSHIISLVGVAWSTLQNLVMVMEFMDQGDLQSHLAAVHTERVAAGRHLSSGSFSWRKQKLQFARAVASALQYLHSLSPTLIHRDIKSKNVLLGSSSEGTRVKVADFGISRRKYSYDGLETSLTMTAAVGTVSWTAPELLVGEGYAEQIDIYSFGVLLTELDTCQLPYHDPESAALGLAQHPLRLMKEVLRNDRRPKLSDACPAEIRALTRDCLLKDPSARPTASRIVERLDVVEALYSR